MDKTKQWQISVHVVVECPLNYFNKENTLPSPQSATPSQYLDIAIQSPLRQDHCPPLHPWLQDSSSSPAIFEIFKKKTKNIEMFTTGFDEKRVSNFYELMNQSEQVLFFIYYCRPGCWVFFFVKTIWLVQKKLWRFELWNFVFREIICWTSHKVRKFNK